MYIWQCKITGPCIVKVSYDELMDAKVFYYTDLYHSLHPYNLVNGPLDIPYTNYTDMWAMKMRKIFNSLDVKKKGKLCSYW